MSHDISSIIMLDLVYGLRSIKGSELVGELIYLVQLRYYITCIVDSVLWFTSVPLGTLFFFFSQLFVWLIVVPSLFVQDFIPVLDRLVHFRKWNNTKNRKVEIVIFSR